MGGVPKTSETSRAFSSALPMICSRYPLDNPHSRHRSLRESEYDQDRSTHPPTSSSLGGSRCTACIDDHFSCIWRAMKIMSVVPLFRRNPHCDSGRIVFTISALNCDSSISANIFPADDKRVMLLQFSHTLHLYLPLYLSTEES